MKKSFVLLCMFLMIIFTDSVFVSQVCATVPLMRRCSVTLILEPLLHKAIRQGNMLDLARLLENHEHLVAVDLNGDTAWHALARIITPESPVKYLLMADMLMLATSKYNKPFILNESNNLGQTALHLAAESGSVHLIRRFVSWGASLLALDTNGKLPSHIDYDPTGLVVVAAESVLAGVPL
jgi:ankyrin repeat protein